MQKEYSIINVEEKAIKIHGLFKLCKSIVSREEGNRLKIPKMHELLHICREILCRGPPMNCDTCSTESYHQSTVTKCKTNQKSIWVSDRIKI